MLGAVLYVQHYGRHVHKTQLRLSAGRDRVHFNDMARVKLWFAFFNLQSKRFFRLQVYEQLR